MFAVKRVSSSKKKPTPPTTFLNHEGGFIERALDFFQVRKQKP